MTDPQAFAVALTRFEVDVLRAALAAYEPLPQEEAAVDTLEDMLRAPMSLERLAEALA